MTQTSSPQPHIPVLLEEVRHFLSPERGGIFVDGTFGVGGYTRQIMKDMPSGHLVAFDRDEAAAARASIFKATDTVQFTFVASRFSQMKERLHALSIDKVDGIVLDLGVSSPQLDEAVRGFSFKKEGPLDMRMGLGELTAKDVVNTFPEEEIANILYLYGDETYSRRIARRIVASRKEMPIETTTQLADLVRASVPPKVRHGKIDAATKSFQALRIFVNEEIKELETFLHDAPSMLNEGGRLVLVSFHSLEDRLAKNFFKETSRTFEDAPIEMPWIPTKKVDPLFKVLTKKAVSPGAPELVLNPRARSAKLRAGERTGAHA
ncbi:MAG: 16S rRNA (cytosine(1402)-N(4))-methyltransferase [Candidatus Puniceispirillum sp.]|nr:16S rRNA (cytosine(1402)-N(4))-methyltransferase [Candidatus Puniceispirillum sp.]